MQFKLPCRSSETAAETLLQLQSTHLYLLCCGFNFSIVCSSQALEGTCHLLLYLVSSTRCHHA